MKNHAADEKAAGGLGSDTAPWNKLAFWRIRKPLVRIRGCWQRCKPWIVIPQKRFWVAYFASLIVAISWPLHLLLTTRWDYAWLYIANHGTYGPGHHLLFPPAAGILAAVFSRSTFAKESGGEKKVPYVVLCVLLSLLALLALLDIMKSPAEPYKMAPIDLRQQTYTKHAPSGLSADLISEELALRKLFAELEQGGAAERLSEYQDRVALFSAITGKVPDDPAIVATMKKIKADWENEKMLPPKGNAFTVHNGLLTFFFGSCVIVFLWYEYCAFSAKNRRIPPFACLFLGVMLLALWCPLRRYADWHDHFFLRYPEGGLQINPVVNILSILSLVATCYAASEFGRFIDRTSPDRRVRLRVLMFSALCVAGFGALTTFMNFSPAYYWIHKNFLTGIGAPVSTLLWVGVGAVITRAACRVVDVELGSCFVSYSTEDSEFQQSFTRKMLEKGMNVKVDVRVIRPGTHIDPIIEQAISTSTYFVVLLSAHSTNSEWVAAELHLAYLQEKSQGLSKVSGGTLVSLEELEEFVDKSTLSESEKKRFRRFLPGEYTERSIRAVLFQNQTLDQSVDELIEALRSMRL